MKSVLTCLQPTGDLHLGNYFGAVQNAVSLQGQYDCRYGIVDYHSMTMPYKASKLRENTWNLTFQLLACGLEIENVFLQSLVPEHAELAWILSCVTSYGELSRMTQFKDKSNQIQASDKNHFISGGLFYYPVLQAADILIYHADYVPIGRDQQQHLELTRNIAERFNHQFKTDYFALPEPLFTETPKILSTADPSRKMSKSAGQKHFIGVFADENRIKKQIRSAVTDTGQASDEMSPGIENLFMLLQKTGPKEIHQNLMAEYKNGELRYSDLKEAVSTHLTDFLKPIQEKHKEILANKKDIKYQIKQSSATIRQKAIETLDEVRDIVGLQKLRRK